MKWVEAFLKALARLSVPALMTLVILGALLVAWRALELADHALVASR